MQIDADQPVAVILLLHAPDIAVGAVGKDDRDDVDAVFHRSGEFLHVVHEPAVARDRHHRQIGSPHFGAERGRKAGAERALIAAVDVAAGVIDRERHAPDIPDLRQILDINAVIGQFGAHRPQIFALRAQIVRQSGEGAGFQRVELLLA